MNRLKYAVVAIAAVPLTMALVPTAPKPEEVGLSSDRLALRRHHCEPKRQEMFQSRLVGGAGRQKFLRAARQDATTTIASSCDQYQSRDRWRDSSAMSPSSASMSCPGNNRLSIVMQQPRQVEWRSSRRARRRGSSRAD